MTSAVQGKFLPAMSRPKKMLVTGVKKRTIDHFSGKQDKLQAAIDQTSKYKQPFQRTKDERSA